MGLNPNFLTTYAIFQIPYNDIDHLSDLPYIINYFIKIRKKKSIRYEIINLA